MLTGAGGPAATLFLRPGIDLHAATRQNAEDLAASANLPDHLVAGPLATAAYAPVLTKFAYLNHDAVHPR